MRLDQHPALRARRPSREDEEFQMRYLRKRMEFSALTIFLARDRAGHQFLFLLLFQPCLDSFQPEEVLSRPLLQTHLDIPYRVQNPLDDDVLQTVDPSLSLRNRLP